MIVEYGTAEELAPAVLRLVAANPGPMTFKGTNSYLIGRESLALVDPGPDDAAHVEAIVRAAAGRPITHILVTHTHRDHIGGLERLQHLTGAPSLAIAPSVYGAADAVVTSTGQAPAAGAGEPAASEKSIREAALTSFVPDIGLRDGERVEAGDCAIEVVHTPGHTPDHVAFRLLEGGILFTGDHVMGWNTTVVIPPEGRMAHYMDSLERLYAADADRLYLPGHGDVVRQPRRLVKAFLMHRRMREAAILDVLAEGPATIDSVTARVHQGLAENLMAAARLQVEAQLEWLSERGLAVELRVRGQPSSFSVPPRPA
ncbi:MAG: MBL fold metallo-hydrolase [Rhizobiales bacterium]|nr:MBL fold metallo-hydrolase [Hyphomicrobiales bacterium]